MFVAIYYLFSYVVFFYTMAAMVCMTYLAIQSIRAQRRMEINLPDDDTVRYILKGSPITPSVSIIAPAYNEEEAIVSNVHSMMNIYYPDLEIIIVNDASTDKTMDILIDEFKLVEVPFTNTFRVPSKPIKRVLRSSDERYKRLVVVDKEHGGRKADGSNAGINICTTKYFVSTDVDCIIEPMALYRMMWLVVNSHDPMIGVSATMLMSNGCKIEDGRVTEAAVPNNPFALYQQLEYMRSFLVGKMGWSPINALPNISGGFGFFNTDVVVKSGGYDPMSMAEDVDMLLRMVTYMRNSGRPFRLAQVPQVCCWTEGFFSMRMMWRQRVRWGRGLCEIVSNHWKLFFNAHYGPIGAFTLPYILLFEFAAPIIEFVGFFFMIWLILIGAVNWNTAFVIYAMIYGFSVSLGFVVMALDYSMQAVNWKSRPWAYTKLAFAAFTEPFLYHPLVTICSLWGYISYLRGGVAVWKSQRRSSGKSKKKEGKDEAAAESAPPPEAPAAGPEMPAAERPGTPVGAPYVKAD